jgi:hypothetical protein
MVLGMRPIPRAFLAVWGVWLVAGVSFAVFYRPPTGSAADFRSLYAAGYLAVHQPSQLYSLAAQQAAQNALDPPAQGVLPFVHLGYEALLYAPFTLLGYPAAYTCCVVVNLLLLLGSFVSVREVFSRVLPVVQPRPGMVMFLFLPVFFTLLQGQDSLLLLLICCLVLRSLLGGHDARAGAVLALALFKFQIAVPLLLLLALRKGWRVVAGFVPAGVALVAGSVALAGTRNVAELRSLLVACTLGPDAGSSAQALVYVHPAAMPNLMGLAFTLLGGLVSGRLALLIVLLLSVGTMGVGIWRMRRTGDEVEAFGVAILCTVLVSYHLYLHDATLLVIPLALWGARVAGGLLLLAPLPLLLFASSEFCLLAVPIIWLLVGGSQPGLPEWRSGVGSFLRSKAAADPG